MRIKTEVRGLEVEVNEEGEVIFWDYGERLSWGTMIDSYGAKRVCSRMEKVKDERLRYRLGG